MIWIEFILSSALIVLAAVKLAEYGDVIAIRTKLGRAFIGVILMAAATSLPEFLTAINSIRMDIPDLSGGNIFGANMYNMLLLAFVSLLGWRERALRKVRRRHGLTAGGSVFMILLATFFIYANIDIKIGWVGIDSIIIIITYLVLVYLLRVSTVVPGEAVSEEPDDSTPKLWKGLLGFSIASAVLVAVMPWMVRVADDIAELSGLSEGFIGVALMAFVTTMPELVATIAAVRMRVYDLAIGNLFGSNMFNIFALGLVDILFTKGRFLNTISPEFILVGFIGMIMTLIALIGNQARLKRRLFFVELDATALVVTFILGMILIYNRGLGM
jgi:cation:H+ antiporter